MKTLKRLLLALLSISLLLLPSRLTNADDETKAKVKPSGRVVIAEVVAFDQPFMLNRLGANMTAGEMFALRKDVERIDPKGPLPGYSENPNLIGYAGNVQRKDYKRARPLVLRANVGDILEIRFTNLLTNQTTGQFAGCHVMGLSLAKNPDEDKGIDSDSSWVGQNNNSFAANAGSMPTPTPAGTAAPQRVTSRVYRYFVDAEGVFVLYSAANPTALNEANNGLFGCVIVQPPNAEYYRSQVLRTDLNDATYYSHNLPANMLLHRAPDDEQGKEQHWFLTTYRTRLHDFVVKNVEVVIGDPEVVKQFHGAVSQEKIEATRKPEYLERAPDGSFAPMSQAAKTSEADVLKKQKEGSVRPQGKIFSRDTGHPLIDYGIGYSSPAAGASPAPADSAMHSRPSRWPVLQMLYPEVKRNPDGTKLTLKAQRADPARGVKEGAEFFQLADNPQLYKHAITQLDTGAVPRELWPVLNDWGITSSLPNLTRVGPQRGYFDGTLDATKPFPTDDSNGYIWLLTGMNLKQKPDATARPNTAVIIQGNQKDLTLRFLEVELQLFHSDLTAIITGPQAEGFGNMQETPSAFLIPNLPARPLPYREFALAYHNIALGLNQAFPEQGSGPLSNMLGTGNDGFCINYGSAAIGAEILANRLGVGPEGVNQDGTDLKFEEFFLSSWAVGDPAMLVDRPANSGGTRATQALYADDPSNVYHSYMRDHVKMRIYNAGLLAPHVHHLHAHQWPRTPNSDESSYLDSQLLVPGAAFTLEITYNGSGNRNQTVGDSIFHCHFYPHFAQGMWSLWRVHDVFEEGTPLDPSRRVMDVRKPDGKVDPAQWVRALPDAEIETGTPIPAIVPLPTLAMPPIPPRVRVTKIPDLPATPAGGAATLPDLKSWVPFLDKPAPGQNSGGKNLTMGRMTEVEPKQEGGKPVLDKDGKPIFSNPGFPFFVPGVAGHRPPHPPLDMGWEEKNGVPDLNPDGTKKYIDGGLPRHQVLGGQVVREFHSPWDFTKDYIRYDDHEKPVDGAIVAYRIPEDGTPIEKAAMEAHRTRTVKTVQPDGRQGNFIHNGLAPVSGAPFADPGVDDQGNAVRSLRKYRAAVIQKDVVFNKAGWHYPQQRFITLWEDVKPTFDEKRPAQPFFFRANSGETVEYWHTNLVPEYYELDDFQVRTPTDIIGQHIHLVKFDVLASDGAVNGFNYEDGTISPDDVRGRIHAITRPFATKAGAEYSLFEMTLPKPGENYVPAIDWTKFVATKPVPTEWEGGYLQKQMTQGDIPDEKRVPVEQRLHPPAGQNWNGAMTTIQRFSTDPLLNEQGIDRTVRTVFTHDHFGPSTHQQAGLYAGFLVEPEKSTWRDPVTGDLLYDPVNRSDGGPTSWEAMIEPQNLAQSYREFAVEFQDLQLAYTKDSPKKLRLMKDLKPDEFATPITFPTPLPQPNTPVPPTMIKTLKENGITLTNQAKFVTLPPGMPGQIGILDDTPQSLYRYGGADAKDPAFSLATVSNGQNGEQLQLTFLHGTTWSDGRFAINPNNTPPLQPEIVSSGGGTYSVNYRSEPLSLTSNLPSPTPVGRVASGTQPNQTDMAFAFASIDRPPPWNQYKPDVKVASPDGTVPSLFARPEKLGDINGPWRDFAALPKLFPQPSPGTQKTATVNEGNLSPLDPYTPLMRGYQGDKVQVRALVGAHTQPHSFTINGVKWLGEMMAKNSGFKNGQEMGISEHFEFQFELPPASTTAERPFADYLYAPSSGSTGINNGVWGIIRSYDIPPTSTGNIGDFEFTRRPLPSLLRLPPEANRRPYELDHGQFAAAAPTPPAKLPLSVVPPPPPDVEFEVVAQNAPITYNDRGPKIQNNNGIVYTVSRIWEKKGDKLVRVTKADGTDVTTKPGAPFILRVKAGQWVGVSLTNNTGNPAASPTASPAASPVTIGLHSQLLGYDVSVSDGMNVGFNRVQTIAPAAPKAKTDAPLPLTYLWYAGDLSQSEDGKSLNSPHPRELGATNLCPAAPLNQDGVGLLGALIVEPADSYWDPKDYVTEQARIVDANKKEKLLFHDFVLIEQANITDSNKPGNKAKATYAVNNRSEDLGFRLGNPSPTPASTPYYQVLSNSLPNPLPSGPPIGAPKTPIFTATAGDPVRFRVLQPGGDSAGISTMFEIHGHSWQQEPWINSSATLGDNPQSNVLAADILVPHKALNILIDSAGGPDKVPGDYLYYNFMGRFSGAWGIFRVEKKK
ncbi:MAG TPA: hypothetical protein VJU77_04825 [Chthoniobacterales bacterium]|nr:hypothetical protein [Chthoniobacterales bacterium]